MEAGTVGTARGTGSKTMADLPALAAEKYGDMTALLHKEGDKWVETSFSDLGATVREVALGLMDLGVEKGDKIAILGHTRPEWTFSNFGIIAAGATSVAIYQTNSPEECHYVLEHSESRGVVVEDAEQLAKIREVQGDLPKLDLIVVMEAEDGDGDVVTLDEVRERGRRHDAAELDERTASVSPEDDCVYIYTSGTTGPPKGCVLTHGNYRSITSMVVDLGSLEAQNETVYLFLPLAHSFAQLVQFLTAELGLALAYWEKDPKKIIPNLMEVRPSFFPSVPRIFEKIYTLAMANAEDPAQVRKAVELGLKVRKMQQRGEEVPGELQAAFDKADEALFQNVRNLFGGQIRHCVSGAAPIAMEILEFFYACGVPILEGYGMTETATASTANTLANHRLGSVGRPYPGVELRIAEDGEVLIKGPNIFKEYYKNEGATEETKVDGWLHSGDLGRLDEDGYLYITGRKKDIIITAGGKNITPANLENGIKQNRWVSQAVVVGDRRPYLVALVTLDPEDAPVFAQEHGLDVASLPSSEEMRAEIQKTVDEVNERVGRVEQIKKFAILEQDLSPETGELTASLKVKRGAVVDNHGDEIEALYSG